MKTYFLFLAVLIMSVSSGTAHATDAAPVACPMIAKLCPDGSSVSPQGPNCEIPPCPNGGDKELQPPSGDPADAGDCDGDDCQQDQKKTDPNND